MKSQPYQMVLLSPMMIMGIDYRKQRAQIPGITPMIMPISSLKLRKMIRPLENISLMERANEFKRLRIVLLPRTFIRVSIRYMKKIPLDLPVISMDPFTS